MHFVQKMVIILYANWGGKGEKSLEMSALTVDIRYTICYNIIRKKVKENQNERNQSI